MLAALSKFKPPFVASYGVIRDKDNCLLLNAEATKDNYDLAREIATALNGAVERPFWVVEKYILGKLHYWSAGATGRGHGDGWSLDIAFATKFADSESADQVMVRLCDGNGRSAQHQFILPA